MIHFAEWFVFRIKLSQHLKLFSNVASRATVETTLNGSILSIHNVSAADAGAFICLAHNGIPRHRPATIREKLYLLVNRECSPNMY